MDGILQPPTKARLSTPYPLDVPRWDDREVDNIFAARELTRLMQETPAPPEPEPSSLTLPGLGLGLSSSDQWLDASRAMRDTIAEAHAPKPAPAPAPVKDGVNTGGSPVAVPKGGGISAYGYKGVTGLKNLKGSAPYGFQPEMWSALSRANAAMKAAGLGTFSVTDGFRSYDQQVDVKRRKKNLAATPGRSIHGLGLAADLKLTRAQQEWLRKNGARYGLYAGAGYSKEPWHWQLLPSLYKRGW